MNTRRKALLVGAGAVTAAGAALAAFLPAIERSLLYHPIRRRSDPDGAGPAIDVVEIRTSDGETLLGWWLPPADETRPVILFFNGNGDSLALQTGRWERIAEQGVGFLALAYRGYDGSTGIPSEKGLILDGAAAYEWLSGKVDPGRIVIHGFSLGSGVAVQTAARHKARALILEAPFTSIVNVAKHHFPFAPVSVMRDQYLSRKHISEVRTPLLIVHGDSDSVVPFDQGRELFSLAHKPKTFVRMIGSDHNTLARDGLYDHVWRFLGVPFEGTTAYQGKAAPFETTAEA